MSGRPVGGARQLTTLPFPLTLDENAASTANSDTFEGAIVVGLQIGLSSAGHL